MSATTEAKTTRLSFYTSYRQFYVVDPDADYDTAGDFWSDTASRRGLAISDGVLGVSTASYGHIRCFFQVADTEPTMPLAPWQRVVEGSIALSTGRYAVLSSPHSNSIHEGSCAPGDYRLRVYGAFLDNLVKDTHGDDYFDFYWLVLWPAPHAEPRVLRKYDTTRKPQN